MRERTGYLWRAAVLLLLIMGIVILIGLIVIASSANTAPDGPEMGFTRDVVTDVVDNDSYSTQLAIAAATKTARATLPTATFTSGLATMAARLTRQAITTQEQATQSAIQTIESEWSPTPSNIPVSSPGATTTALDVPPPTTTPLPTWTTLPSGEGTFTPMPPRPTMVITLRPTIDNFIPSTFTLHPTGLAYTQPTPIAEAPVTIELYGRLLGYGTLRLYSDTYLVYPATARVELELHLERPIITPPPDILFGEPVQRVTATLLSVATPRTLLDEIFNQEVYERMGASLTCSPDIFTGCDERGGKNVQEIGENDVFWWYWDVKPLPNVEGIHTLTIELWRPDETIGSGSDASKREWGRNLRIEVAGNDRSVIGVSGGDSDYTLLLAVIVSVMVVITGTVVIFRGLAYRRQRTAPRIFISYRRSEGWSTARILHDNLVKMGADVFVDVDDINEGRFAQIIEREIKARDHFIVVLTPQTLDSPWVCQEIQIAIQYEKNIVPVLDAGFRFGGHLPDEIKTLSSYNAVELDPQYFAAAMDRLARFVKLKPDT